MEEASITDEQIEGTLAFAAQVSQDIETLREAEAKGVDHPELKEAVYNGKRKLLAMLAVKVILFLENNERRAKISAKMCPDGNKVLSVEACNNSTSR